ncbi:MAG: hypothetical protein ACFHHU_15060 [Porticoccaceae bacterium]
MFQELCREYENKLNESDFQIYFWQEKGFKVEKSDFTLSVRYKGGQNGQKKSWGSNRPSPGFWITSARKQNPVPLICINSISGTLVYIDLLLTCVGNLVDSFGILYGKSFTIIWQHCRARLEQRLARIIDDNRQPFVQRQ